MCLVKELLGEFARFQSVGLVGDVVAFEDPAGLVAGDLHNHGLGDAGPPKISRSRAPKIMEQ